MAHTRPARARRGRALFALALAATAALGSPSAAWARQPASVEAEIAAADAPREVRAFYRARGGRPLWVEGGRIGAGAERVLDLIASAELDGLDPDRYRPRALAAALRRADEDGSPRALARADVALSRAWAELARDMATPRDVGMHYADAELRPRAPTIRALLDQAAAQPSLPAYLDGLGWMSPAYAQLRRAAEPQAAYADDAALDLLRVNLDRARLLPAAVAPGRYVLVDAAAARLWMYENGRAVGSMKVVVGKPSEPTPMMAGLIRYASVNPYWNLPPDLARLRVAEGALAGGDAFLRAKRFEVLSGWENDATVVRASAIDWAAVRDGRLEARVRQLPGPNNAMGRVKYMFPNQFGVYLHDTPEKKLMREDDRLFSSGCVRLEDAPRLGRWVFGRPVPLKTSTPEKRIDLPAPVPVYITYLTVAAEGGDMVFRPDVYGRDKVRMAGRDAGGYASR